MSTQGGKPIGIRVITQAELDSGAFRLAPGPAVRVTGMAPGTRGVMGGPLTPVFVVDATYERGIEGGAALPVTNLVGGVRATTRDLAIPVYVVSDDGQFAPPAPALDLTAPSDLAAVAISDTEIDLTWTDTAPDADGYKIERSPAGTGTWAEIDDIAPATGYSDTGLDPSTAYDYRIRAYAGVTNGSYSNTATETTEATPFEGAFDGITFAALYALVRFLSAYEGNLIRLRRDSDEAEENFTYASENDPLIDAAAIATWLDGANGFVVTWYDESGNARNATQATTTLQPAYTASGQNGLPVLTFASDALVAAFGAALTQPTTIVCAVNLTSGEYVFDGIGESPRQAHLQATNIFAGSSVVNTGLTLSGFDILVVRFNGASSFAVLDGTQGSNVNPGTDGLTGVTLGARYTFTAGMNGMLAAWGVVNGSQDPDSLGPVLADLYGTTWS